MSDQILAGSSGAVGSFRSQSSSSSLRLYSASVTRILPGLTQAHFVAEARTGLH